MLVCRMKVGAGIDEKPSHLQISLQGCNVQGGPTIFAGRVKVGAGIDENLGDVRMPL